ncbi:MAG: rhodanese-related sulfurtransferase [Nannocystaceae bacterium]|nr:rhodanese-related sulfurtransferase [bacterium]
MTDCVIAAFYGFTRLDDHQSLQQPLQTLCADHQVVGTLLLAPEGVNGTVAGSGEGIERLLAFLRALPGLEGMNAKYASAAKPPFGRMRVRLKREIVTMGVPGIDPLERVGTYVHPKDWNALVDDPDVLLIDTRNDYEVRIGTFVGAVDPRTKSFRDFPDWVAKHVDPTRHKRVAMFCTGGIRCEKATSLLLKEGVSEVYHLEGGILRYLEETPAQDSRWQGECFVFDRRVAVDHALQPGKHVLCFGCLEPLAPEDLAQPAYEAGVCCHRCVAEVDDSTRERRRERMRQIAAARARGETHVRTGPSPEEL